MLTIFEKLDVIVQHSLLIKNKEPGSVLPETVHNHVPLFFVFV